MPTERGPKLAPIMRDALPAFRRHLAGRSLRTQKTYGAIAASFLTFLEKAGRVADAPVARADVEAFLARPRLDGDARAPSSRNQELAALRVLARFAKTELGWTADPTTGIPFVKKTRRDPAVLGAEEVRRLFSAGTAVSPSHERARNLALLAVLATAGLRVHEVVGLDLAQVDIATGTLLAVRRKGGAVGDVPISPAAVALISAWLGERTTMADPDESALFVSSRGTRLSIRSVERLLVRLRAPMETLKRITPHTLRHSAATIGLGFADLATIADLLGHEDVNTTRSRRAREPEGQRRRRARRAPSCLRRYTFVYLAENDYVGEEAPSSLCPSSHTSGTPARLVTLKSSRQRSRRSSRSLASPPAPASMRASTSSTRP